MYVENKPYLNDMRLDHEEKFGVTLKTETFSILIH